MRRLFHLAAFIALPASLTACGGSSYESTASTPTSPGTPSGFVITIATQAGDRSFSPNPAPAGGQPVVFRNNHSVVHRIRLSDGTFLTADIQPSTSSQPVRMPSAGAHYHCSLHPEMTGVVNAASGTPPPACEGPYCGD